MVVRGSCCCDEGAGGASVDHFAPKFLIGNVLAGDNADNYSAGGFTYIADPGDGTGIAAALADIVASGVAADVWIRPGTYTRGLGLARFVVPAGCAIRGAGEGAVNIITNAVDDCIFQLGAGASLERVTLTQRGVIGAAGSALIESVGGSALAPTRLSRVTMSTPLSVLGAQLVGGSFDIDACVVSFTGAGAAPVGISVEGGAANPAFFNIRSTVFSLVNIGVRFGFTGGVAVRDSIMQGCRFAVCFRHAKLSRCVTTSASHEQSIACSISAGG